MGIEDDKATGRIEIFGRQDQKDRALEMILAEVNFVKDAAGKVLKDAPRPEKENADDLGPPLKVWVRDREAGKVIGRGGETVREVMEKTGGDIKVQKSKEMVEGSNQREVQINGTKE